MHDYFDLGDHTCAVSTRSADAQRWFDRGLVWCYGFNHEEAVRCFENTLDADPDCAMACWGIAYATGPFYNNPWEWFADDERVAAVALCHAHAQRAMTLAEQASPVEQALVKALTRRFQSDQVVAADEFGRWNDAYAQAMRKVVAAFPEHLDVITLAAEALMTRTAWRLWDVHAGVPAEGADTLEAMDLLERGMRLAEECGWSPHPGMLHLYIHVVEMSPHPERGLHAADQLRYLSPGNGHLLHMPSHIDVLCGQYDEAIAANDRAIAADRKYQALRGVNEFYAASCCHDFHLKMHAAMFMGQYQIAMEAADGIRDLLPEEALRVDRPYLAGALETFYAMKSHVWVRFGRWQEIIDEPLPGDPRLYLITTTLLHNAKGVAYAATGDLANAAQELQSHADMLAMVPADHVIGNNNALDVLAVGRQLLYGEIEYRKGNCDQAFGHLRQAVESDDRLIYSEPWDWMHPPRHALGALLLEQDHVEEAAAVYRADLGLDDTLPRCLWHPDNVWALHGYVECLNRMGRHGELEALEDRLALAQARADVTIDASCCCRV